MKLNTLFCAIEYGVRKASPSLRGGGTAQAVTEGSRGMHCGSNNYHFDLSVSPKADSSPYQRRAMNSAARRFITCTIVLVLILSIAPVAYAADAPVFSYELQLTDANGMTVEDPRSLSDGDVLNVEIVLRRTDQNGAYDLYGIEFRLLTVGLTYNNDGSTLRGGTDVREEDYSDGKYVGFAWYDMQQIGENTNNPVLVGKWSYTVSDASIVNIRVPVALVYVTGHTEGATATGPATIKLDLNLNGGELIGDDITGKYVSGTAVTLPDAEREGYTFLGWTDGLTIFPPNSQFVVSGIVTLTAVWEPLELNRHLRLDPNGGEIVGEDITGYYADGMIVILPDVTREGYTFKGWFDGVNTYEAGAEYIVYNTVTIVAQWEAESAGGLMGFDYGWVAPVLIGVCGLGLLLLLLLWKRKTVKYSLVNGDVALDYTNGDKAVQIDVMLYCDGIEYHLARSEIVEAKQKLRFIHNTDMPIADITEGTYDGKLLIYDGSKTEMKKCRIKAVDRELDEKSN